MDEENLDIKGEGTEDKGEGQDPFKRRNTRNR